MTTLAIIQVDLYQGRFGHAVSLLDELVGKTVLQHTIDRIARIEGVDEIVLMHPADQTLSGKYDMSSDGPPITTAVMQTRGQDAWLHDVIGSGRKWALTAWRGGIGGMTIYDEMLPAAPFLQVMQDRNAESLVALRGDWCCIDPDIAAKQLELHRSAPEAMRLTFTQAPPGISPLVVHRSVLRDMAEHSATVANLLCYNPSKPVIDPVGKDMNVQVPASVRGQYRRFVYDTPRAIEHLQAIAERLGEGVASADAVTVTDTSREVETNEPWRELERLPQQLNVELSPRRAVNGPIVPQHHLDLPREDMADETADELLKPLHRAGDSAILFGGLGDPLLHNDWFEHLQRATSTGVLGVGVETDLLVDEDTVDRLATLPLDVIAVRINADTAATYEKLMGVDGFGQVMDNLQRLFKARNGNRQKGQGFRGWIVPRLVKVAENLSDLETFFERWMTIAGWAVVDRAKTGRGLIPDMSPVPMEVPEPPGAEFVPAPPKQRLTVLSDGTVCLCSEDWLGRLPLGRLSDRGLAELWRGAASLADVSRGDSVVCPSCARWLETQRRQLASI
ncbi:MAG: SPASM domain-containing protein [Planctomycetota bacterium]